MNTPLKLIALFLFAGIVVTGAVFISRNKTEAPQPQEQQQTEKPAQPSTTTPPSSQELSCTDNDQLYRNEEWGFMFCYPEELILQENVLGYSPFSPFDLVIAPEGYPIYSSHLPFFINIVTPDFVDGNSFWRLQKNKSIVSIDQFEGVKYEYEFELSQETIIILPLLEHKMILGTTKGYEYIFNQILSSFRFLK